MKKKRKKPEIQLELLLMEFGLTIMKNSPVSTKLIQPEVTVI